MNGAASPVLQDDFSEAGNGLPTQIPALIEQTMLCRASALFVFGNASILAQSAWQAARLYNEGFAPRIIISGGVKAASGLTEARAISNELLRYGIPKASLLLEERSKNTLENVVFSRRQFQDCGIDSLIGIGHIAAGKRFLMTLSKNWPEVLPMFVSVNPYRTAAADWERNDRFAEKVREEHQKIPLYKNKGHICDIDLDRLNQRIAARQEILATRKVAANHQGAKIFEPA